MRLTSLMLVLLLAPAGAQAKREHRAAPPPPPAPREEQAHFLGPHPIAARLGGGYCYIDVPHIHAYAPDRPVLFQQVGNEYVFTGDPVPFGYEGPRTTFYGPHPVPLPTGQVDFVPRPVYCSIRGPHFHDYAAPVAPDYRVKDNVVFYVGPLAPEYVQVRPQIEQAVDEEYRPFVAQRPQIAVTPPPEWHGEVWVAPPAGPQVVVTPPQVPQINVIPPQAPQIDVIPPQAPQIDVEAPQAPQVVVTAPQPPSVHISAPAPRIHVVAPSPPSVQFYVPQPPSIHIVAPSPPGVFIAPPPGPRVHVVGPGWGDHDRGWGDHDRGRHRGWHKHGRWHDDD